MESENPVKTYLVKEKFALNLGEGANKQSFNVAPGDELQFDGLNVVYKGIKGLATSLRTVITFGWIVEITSKETPAAKPSAKKAAVVTPPPTPPQPPKQVDPSYAGSRRTVSSDEYGKEVKNVRNASTIEPASTVVSSTAGATRRTVISEEEKEVKAVRATSGAPTPARAAEMAKTAAAAPAQAAAKPVQYMQPNSRVRRAVVQHDEEEVALAGSRRATPTQYTNEVLANNSAGATDEEIVSPEFANQGKKGRGATSRVASASQATESQAPSMVIKSRRAAAAPINNSADMTKVSNADILALEKGPVAMAPQVDSGEGVVVASTRSVRVHSSEAGMTASVTVSGSGTVSVPKAQSSSTDTGVIMSKTATVSSSDSSIYDPANYLGLAKRQDAGFTPMGASKTASVAVEAPAAVVEEAPVAAAEEEPLDLDFGDGTPVVAEPEMVLDHNGKLVPGRKAPTTFQSVSDEDVKEEDYSKLNEEAAPAGEPASSTTVIASNEVVPANFLETLIVGGLPWSKLPYQAKIQYINGKRVGNRMVGGCNNLSILKLISGQRGLPPSVTGAANERIAALKS